MPTSPDRAGTTRHRNLLITLVAIVVGIGLVAAALTIAGGGITGSTPTAQGTGGDTALALADTSTTTIGIAATTTTTTTIATAAVSSPADLTDASVIGEAVVPSVVTIEISDTFRNREIVVGSGSGVVWDNEGHIITNAHVVDAGASYEVVTSDGRVYDAVLVGIDSSTDLAVLQIDAADLIPISLGTTDTLLPGDPAIAVGSPLGLDGGPSLTVGVISALGRTVEIDSATTLYGMLQADAPITEGSSGGALVNESGELIGITSAVGVSTVGVEGIGFSTPIEIVERVVTEIVATGEASQPIIGIGGTTAFATMRDGGEEPIGVQVEEVALDSAAAAGGIEVGDIIAAIDGEQINTMAELIYDIRTHSTGDTVTLTLTNEGAETTVSVLLSNS
jgi:S1-C subfamily serine protease